MKGFAGSEVVGGKVIIESFAISQWSRVPDSQQNSVPASSLATSTTAKRSTIMKTWISAYMYMS